MDVVDKIRQMPTGVGGPGMRDVPKEPVIIKKVTITEPQDSKTSTPSESKP
jgi:hypothetical protein